MKLNLILSKYEKKRENLLAVLQDVQENDNYLSKDILKKVAEEFSLPLSEVFSLATYYKAFSLKPKGKYIIFVCMGTACYVRGSEKILQKIETDLGIKTGDTTTDGMFTIETVNCLGACALGPLVVVNNDYYGEMTSAGVKTVLKEYRYREKE
ncbi:NAD(P)H-dependent oxidoreductase subunit E [bacterium]|nr:NAD(P)H-dependent oxidoreductase subunit E [bacterium]